MVAIYRYFLGHFRHNIRHEINKFMSNRKFLQSLYDDVKSMGIVTSQYQFGQLCGRDQSWFSCAKSVNRSMSLSAIVSLAVSLQSLPQERVPKKMRPQLKKLITSLWEMVEAHGSQNHVYKNTIESTQSLSGCSS